MAKINIEITASVEDFSIFADELGYMTQITTFVDNVPTTVTNPQSKTDFLQQYMKDIVVAELYRRKAQAIDQQTLDIRAVEKATLKSTITNAVTVTSQV